MSDSNVSRLRLRIAALAVAIGFSGCGGETVERASNEVVSDDRTELEKLLPGQRMPSDYASVSRGAYVAVNLIQNDDAVSGQMTITIDGANVSDCEAATEWLEPWLRLCRDAVEQGYATFLSAPVEITRASVTEGGKVSPAGAHASFPSQASAETVHVVLMNESSGSPRYVLRLRPTAELALGDYQPSLEVSPELAGSQEFLDTERAIEAGRD